MTVPTTPARDTATRSADTVARPRCRFCHHELRETFVDLGTSPLCESFVPPDRCNDPERFYPLRAYVCARCFLVQVPALVSGEAIFGQEYAYFSSFSDSWLSHAERFVDAMTARLGLSAESQVVEVGSNDGYLLRHVVARGIPALGIEPAPNVARAAVAQGVPTRVAFFNRRTARALVAEGTQADLLVGNNVLAHVPELNDFVAGLRLLVKPAGVISLEFPHLMRLIEGNQFDTIYQEHYCYFSFLTVRRILAAHRLVVFDVEELPTHGGSLRVYARRDENHRRPIAHAVTALHQRELAAGYARIETYRTFAQRVAETKWALLEFLIQAKRDGKRVVGYGAPGKANTLLNYCGVRQDFIDYTVDRNPYKHGRALPGTRIPIAAPARIAETRPDYVLILPWNLKDEVMDQLAYVREWGAKFVVPIPRLTVYA